MQKFRFTFDPITLFNNTYPWILWGLAVSFFFAHYLPRVSTGVIVPELMHTFNTDASGIGRFSAYFYYSYLGMQIPGGLLLDRFGIRRLLTLALFLCGAGCFIFAKANAIGLAEIGRLLLGGGAAFAFLGTMKIITTWFEANRVGLLVGSTQAIGMLGAAFAEAPMSYAMHSVGWREIFFGLTGLFIILSILMFVFARDRYKPTQQANHLSLVKSLNMVLGNPQSWINGLFIGLLFAPVTSFGELWGVTYLSQTHHLTISAAASAIGAIFIGWGLGGPLMGYLSDQMGRRKPLMLASAVLSLGLLSIILYVSNLGYLTVWLLLFIFGVVNTGVGLSYAVSVEINPLVVAGTSIAFANMMSVMIGAAFQPMIGQLLDWHWHGTIVNNLPVYTVNDYQFAITILPLGLLIAALLGIGLKETYCKSVFELE